MVALLLGQGQSASSAEAADNVIGRRTIRCFISLAVALLLGHPHTRLHLMKTKREQRGPKHPEKAHCNETMRSMLESTPASPNTPPDDSEDSVKTAAPG
mmetsp:Transcript_411/g.505  ORF Transcript_411/g.505 Transcript_411/m.505 type:complete len:99 (+) Transcript_411:274-570(+)